MVMVSIVQLMTVASGVGSGTERQERDKLRKILVSACLLGQPLRYDGSALAPDSERLARWQGEGRLVPLCPEVAGGLPVPRPPAEIRGGSAADVLDGRVPVMTNAGGDVTAAFIAGAESALALCREHDIGVAILTESSPSCGSSRVNDGGFRGRKIAGEGVTTALLRRHGIAVFSQHELAGVERWLREREA